MLKSPGGEHKFILSMPHELRDQISKVAQENMRSLTRQINFMLKSAIEAGGTKDDGARNK